MRSLFQLMLLTTGLLATTVPALAQSGVGIGTTSPHNSAALDVSSVTKGLLFPRLTQTQRDAVAAPAAGLTIYNTSTGVLNTWDGSKWTAALTDDAATTPALPVTFGYTGAPQTYTVPAGVTRLLVDASGAQGGPSTTPGNSGQGGLGGRVRATLTVVPGQVVTIYVGGAGNGAGNSYNGGVAVTNGSPTAAPSGGATDLRLGGSALADRVLVAGGGGGAAGKQVLISNPLNVSNGANGGAGGGLTGATASPPNPGGGGTPSSGGAAGGTGGSAGSLGQGGASANGGAGGGGYYGGGGGAGQTFSAGINYTSCAGGGGSSYTDAGLASAVVHTQGYRPGNGTVTLQAISPLSAPTLDGSNFANLPWTRTGGNLHPTTPTDNVGIGTSSPRGKLDVASGNTYLVANPDNGSGQSAYLPGHLYLAPYSGTSGTAYVQARVPNPTAATNVGLNLRTTSAGVLVEALALAPGGALTAAALAGTGTRVVTATAAGTLGSAAASTLGDNLGNHTATQSLDIGYQVITGTSFNAVGNGLGVNPLGGLILGQNNGGNVAIGYIAGSSLTYNSGTGAGSENVLVGTYAGQRLSTGRNNVFLGTGAGRNSQAGNNNVCVGQGAGGDNETGSNNVFGGTSAGISNTTGSNNLYQGADAGYSNTTGTGNVALGHNAGSGQLNSTNTTALGIGAQIGAAGLSNATALGANAVVNTSNALVLGNGANVGIGTSTPAYKLDVQGTVGVAGSSVLELGTGVVGKEGNAGKIGYGTFSGGAALDIVGAGTTGANRKIKFYAEGGAVFTGSVTGVGAFNTSDARFKQHVRPLTGALAAVLALRGVRYDWNPLGVQHGGRAGAEQVGLIAQEVEALFPELVSTDADGYKAVNYAQLAPVLIEAIKELTARNAALQVQAAEATAATQTFEARLRALEAGAGQARK